MGNTSDEEPRYLDDAPPAKGPWQFSLASLLIAFVVFAIGFGTMIAYPHSICVVCFLCFLAGLWFVSTRIGRDEAE